MMNRSSFNSASQLKGYEEKENCFTPEKVLVIDDEAEIRDTLVMILTRIGFDVLAASSGAAAIEITNEENCAVAIVDLNMPGLPGIETVQLLKQNNPDIEVIIYTGHPSLESSLDAIHSQVFDYICKPCHTQILQRAVQRAVERRQLVIENRKLMQAL